MLIRPYEPADFEVVRTVHVEAFGGADDDAVRIFERLVGGDDVIAALSLVAVRDGKCVGHVVGSRALVGGHEVVALGPLGVAPAHQRTGVGQALMHAVLAAADTLRHPMVALLGSTSYYPRFGFVAASRLGIEAPVAEWGDNLQARILTAYRPELIGVFRYSRAFDET